MRKFTAALSFAAHDRGAQAMIAARKQLVAALK
jgi:hypothetical protein